MTTLHNIVGVISNSKFKPYSHLLKIQNYQFHFRRISQNLPCGPCRVICIQRGVKRVNANAQLNAQQIADGDRIVKMKLINDTILAVKFLEDRYGSPKVIGLDGDLLIQNDVAKEFNKNKITILGNSYEVLYNKEFQYGVVELKVICE